MAMELLKRSFVPRACPFRLSWPPGKCLNKHSDSAPGSNPPPPRKCPRSLYLRQPFESADPPTSAHCDSNISLNLRLIELRCPQPRLTRATIAKLQNYHSPGNICELRNVIERAFIISRDGVIDFDLPVAESAAAPRPVTREKTDAEPEFLTEAELQRRERENLPVIPEKARWKIKGSDGAAELLGVKPTTLVNRMKKMGLKRPN